MKVYIKNKFMSLGGSSSVVDENKQPLFKVKGKVFSITRKKYIKTLDNKTLYMVKNKFINWFKHTAYIYDGNKTKIAKVVSKWLNLKNEYIIEGYKDEIKIVGGFFSPKCEIVRNDVVIGTIRRQLTFMMDAFELEGKEEDIPFLIALVIAIDNIVDRKSKTT